MLLSRLLLPRSFRNLTGLCLSQAARLVGLRETLLSSPETHLLNILRLFKILQNSHHTLLATVEDPRNLERIRRPLVPYPARPDHLNHQQPKPARSNTLHPL